MRLRKTQSSVRGDRTLIIDNQPRQVVHPLMVQSGQGGDTNIRERSWENSDAIHPQLRRLGRAIADLQAARRRTGRAGAWAYIATCEPRTAGVHEMCGAIVGAEMPRVDAYNLAIVRSSPVSLRLSRDTIVEAAAANFDAICTWFRVGRRIDPIGRETIDATVEGSTVIMVAVAVSDMDKGVIGIR